MSDNENKKKEAEMTAESAETKPAPKKRATKKSTDELSAAPRTRSTKKATVEPAAAEKAAPKKRATKKATVEPTGGETVVPQKKTTRRKKAEPPPKPTPARFCCPCPSISLSRVPANWADRCAF